MAWVFASLSPAISFSSIGVIVGEFIGAERGIGRLIIESEARAEASGMMVAVIVLMPVGVALSAMIWRLQAYLLRWQQHNMVEQARRGLLRAGMIHGVRLIGCEG